MGRLEEIIAKVFEIDISKIKKEMTPLDIIYFQKRVYYNK